MISSGVRQAVRFGLEAGIPDSTMTVSAWAEAFRYVDRGARKGKWSNDTVPYLVEIMDAHTDPRVREIVFQKPSQSGGSEAIANMIGRRIHLDPTEIAYVAEKEDKAKAWTQESFDTMVRTTDVLKASISHNPEFNNQKIKGFTGGNLYILWATSPAELSSRPLQDIYFDEKAAFVPTKEGDAVKLGEARTKTYSGIEKLVKVSSPRNEEDESDIEKDYLRGDQREYHVPCLQCGEFQTLKWANLKWDGEDIDNAYMVCEINACLIEHDDLHEMLLRGRWAASAPFNGIASFKINQLYSPLMGDRGWSQMIKDFLAAKARLAEGKIGEMKVWVNTALAEPWRPDERIEYADLQLSREPYPADVPAGVLVITGGVDVQDDRLEYEIVGWGRGDESWSIDHGDIFGSPALPDVWDDLTDVLTRRFEGELQASTVDGLFSIACVCIDSGFQKKQVYKFVHANKGRRWFAIKGASSHDAPPVVKGTKNNGHPPVRPFILGTNALKDEIFGFLRATTDAIGEMFETEEGGYGPGSAGFCHFPADERYGEKYLKQLCAEKKVKRFRSGKDVSVYEKVSANARNEALDLRVYATAARMILNPNYEKIAGRRLKHPEPAVEQEQPDSEPVENAVEKPANNNKKKRFVVKNNPFSGGYKP
jgi:phage terminase large subunit GpA-like protein